MRIIIIPASYRTEFVNSASERMRCDWLLDYLPADKYDESQNLKDYDAIIYQKAFHPDLAEKYKHKIQVFDDTDSITRHLFGIRLPAVLNKMTFMTVSTQGLQQEYQRFLNIPVHVVPDGHELSEYKERKLHNDCKPVFVWFGYADNFPDVISLLPAIEGYRLIVIAERSVGSGEFVLYDPATVHSEIIKGDIVLNPKHPLKSNNKTVTAWALGMPVVETKDDVERLLDCRARIKEVDKDLTRYHVKHSAKLLNRLIDRRGRYFRVYVTVPCEHWVHKTVCRCVLLLSKDNRYRIKLSWPSNKPYENNLHHIVKEFIAGDYDYWLSIDSDNPPRNNPLDLIELDLDIVGMPTPIWYYTRKKGERPIYWSAYDYDPSVDAYREHQEREGLQRVDAIGTGCFLIARRVFEDTRLQMGAFIRKLYPDGRVHKGNDMSFCERARECGFEIWTHFDYPCDHYSEIELNTVAQAFLNMYGD